MLTRSNTPVTPVQSAPQTKNTVEVVYDDNTLETLISVNGKTFDTSRINGKEIADWAYPFMMRKVRWNGFYEEMVQVLGGQKAFDLVFEGSDEALAELREAWENPLVALFFASELSSRGAMDIRNEADGEVVIVRIKKSEILHHNSDRALMLSCLPCFSDADQKKLKEFCDSHRRRISEQYVQAYDSAIHRLLHEIRGEYPGFACEMIGEDLLNGFFVAPFKDNERMKLQNGLFYIFGLNREELDHRLDVIRIVVNKNAKKEILHDLKLMNISNSHLYSGFERAAMNIRNKRAEWSEIS